MESSIDLQVQALQARVAELEQENDRLRQEKVQHVAAAKLNEVNAREQEKAAQERAAELAKANEALRRSARNIAQTSSIEDILPLFLHETITVSGASAGAVLRRVGESEFKFVAILQGNNLINGERLEQHPFYNAVKQVSREDPAGWFRRLATGETLWRLTDDEQAGPLPECDEYHRPYQQRSAWDIPYKIGDRVAGYISLAFCTDKGPSQIVTETVTALATQVGLALELTELAEAAKQAVIAREQELAAQERAAELAKANEAMRRVLDLTAQETGIDSLLGNVLQAIAEQFDAPIVEWWEILDNETVAKRLSYWNGQLLAIDDMVGHHGVPQFTIGLTLQHSQQSTQRKTHILIEDVELLPYPPDEIKKIRAWYVENGTRKFLNVPVLVGERTIGGLLVFFPEDRGFSESQIEFGYAMARHVALAVLISTRAEEAKQAAIAREQEKAAQERAAELAKANEVLKRSLDALATGQTLTSFLSQILTSITQQLKAPSAVLWCYDYKQLAARLMLVFDGQTVQPAEQSQHPNAHKPRDYSGPELASIWQGMIRQQKYSVLVIAEDHRLAPPQRNYLLSQGVWGILSVPLVLGSRTSGVFAVHLPTPRTFCTEELEIVQALANQAALAIELTQLAEQAKDAAILEERNRIAGEIHDTLAQAFTGIMMQLQASERLLTTNPTQAKVCLTRAQTLAKSGLTEARRSVWALYTPIDENLFQHLTTIIHAFTEDTEVEIQMCLEGTPYPIEAEQSLNLQRIAQESIANVLRHAHAQQIVLTLTYDRAFIQLQIHDDGQGFDSTRSSAGFGLMGIQQRCDRLNASLTIHSNPGQGTLIQVILPVRSDRHDA